jgi:2',3'-cyclic-nucleotide 2'-phosphodiesterase (5'-nucleotidase family)
MFRFIFILFSLIAWSSVQSQTVRILFTGNLEGQLSGCYCSKTPKAGLLKLRSFVEDYRIQYPGTILVETGSFVKEKDDPIKSKVIVEQIIKMNYDAMIFGPNEEETDEKISIPWKKLPIVSNSKKIPSSSYIIKEFSGIKIGFLGVVEKSPYKYTVEGYNSDNFTPEEEYIQKGLLALQSAKTNFNVLLVHGRTNECRAKTSTKGIQLILCGHDGIIPTDKKEKIENKIFYLQAGSLGNYVGEVVINFKQGKVAKITEKAIDILSLDPPGHPEIEEWLKKNPNFDERH